jgi:hypothetical protein
MKGYPLCLPAGAGRRAHGRVAGNERGVVVIIVMILIATLTLLAVAANRNMVTDIGIASNHLGATQAFYAAEGGAEYAFNKLSQELQKLNPNTASITPPAMSGYAFQTASYIAAVGGTVQVPATGNFDGLTAIVQKYRITSRATESKSSAVGIVAIDVSDQLIPIFQFGIFYNSNLEIFPGANMTFAGGADGNQGRIHSNNNIYLGESGSTRSLTINSKITSAGDISRNRLDGGATDHNVYISDGAGSTPALNIDSSNTTWAAQSQTTWKGRVKTQANGIHSVSVPLPTGGQPIDILGQGDGSMYSKSGLKILNGAATDKDGNAVELRYYDATYKNADGSLKIDPGGTAALNKNPLTTGSVYDYREGTTTNTYDLDMAKLQGNAGAMAKLNDPPVGGDPGILYISSTDASKSVRLQNGSSLPTTGLTVATNNPVYVQGNYNTANNPAAILGDAVTVLSSAWSNSYNSGTSISSRTANATTVNAAFMVGNTETSGSNYSGGAENLIRFLEDWSGKNFNYGGSLVCLWQSQHATKKWPGTGTVYNPPNRIWTYGIQLNNLPPGTPRVVYVQRLGWRQISN